jgi:acetate kinase
MNGALLVLNAGSSSIKFTLYHAVAGSADAKVLCRGQIAGLGDAPTLHATDAARAHLLDEALAADCSHEQALARLLDWIGATFAAHPLLAAAHRVVHGGVHYSAPVVIDADVLDQLRQLIPLAPLHQPHAIAAIDALQASHPGLSQVACFDTAFHHGQSALETTFALPAALAGDELRRYGFHGLSYEFVAAALPALMGAQAAAGRVVIAHLGAGASLCALKDGRSVATTMGFSTLDGLVMGRRCGAIDPGALLYLQQHKGMDADAVSDMLYGHAGLLGVSGVSDDMQSLLASDAPAARFAVDLFVYRLLRELGALAATIGGLDVLVFTAGIGEHAAEIRRRVGEGAAWLGVQIDPAANEAGAARLSPPGARASAWVVATDEEQMMMRHSLALLR